MNNSADNVGPAETLYYNSVFKHGVDDKRRVQIPAKWRRAAEGEEFTMVLWPSAGGGSCLRVLPPAEQKKLLEKLNGIPSGSPDKAKLKRFIGSQSAQVAVDKAGRICLPEEMAAAAGIKSEALFVGLLDRFEVWNPERFQPVQVTDAAVAVEALSLLE